MSDARYRVVFEFDATSLAVATQYASDLDRVWDAHPGITSQSAVLAESTTVWQPLADPVVRSFESRIRAQRA